MTDREVWHQRLFRLVAFGLTDWMTSPKMLQMEIHHPWRYRLFTWPPMMIVIAIYAALVLWLTRQIKF